MFEFQVESITVEEHSALYFICGYITKKENLKATDDILVAGNDNQVVDSEFTTLLSRGQLTYPSGELYTFSLLCYCVFLSLKGVSCRTKLSKIFRIIYDSFIFSFGSTESVIRRLLNTLYNGYVKDVNDSASSEQTMRKKRKLACSNQVLG